MDVVWQELSLGIGDWVELTRTTVRLIVAALLGAVIGYEREKAGKAAGLRTHVLVTLGTCLFVVSGISYGMNSDGLSRIIQGIVTGIGFIGAGSILKRDKEGDIQGLTTSAGIWMAAAIGVSVGLGAIGLAMIATIVSIIVLTLLGKIAPAETQDDPED